jgi:Transposase DDE domain group 1
VATAADGQREYDDYIQRGESEQRLDELKNGLHLDRLSCHRFMANFFRLLLHTAAMNLLNAQRDDPELPEVLRQGQPCTWRTRVIKVAAVIVQTTRRIVVRLAGQWPWWPLYQSVAQRSRRLLSTA